MKQKKIPLRKCTGCNEMKPKKELIRIVRSPEVKNENGEVVEEPQISLDTTGKKSGRGAYVCKNKECFEHEVKTSSLSEQPKRKKSLWNEPSWDDELYEKK